MVLFCGQLHEAQQATRLAEDELAEMTQRHREKVGHWESAQEALDQLTDELQASQDLVQESQQEADHLRGQLGTLQEQVEALGQQVCVCWKPAVAKGANWKIHGMPKSVSGLSHTGIS